MIKESRANRRRNERGSNIAEFGSAFTVFFFCMVIPCINIIGFGASYSLASGTSNATADLLSKSSSQDSISKVLQDTKSNIGEKNLYKVFRLTASEHPIDVKVAVESLQGQEQLIDLDGKQNLKIDRSKNMYRYRIVASFVAKPILDLSSIPIIGQIPVIARPTPIILTQYRDIEHPEFLQKDDSLLSSSL